MMGWWRKPNPRLLHPAPAQFVVALQALRIAEQIADGNDQRAWLIAFQLLKARHVYRRVARSA